MALTLDSFSPYSHSHLMQPLSLGISGTKWLVKKKKYTFGSRPSEIECIWFWQPHCLQSSNNQAIFPPFLSSHHWFHIKINLQFKMYHLSICSDIERNISLG